MANYTVHVGDCIASLRAMAERGERVQCCVTSPPYLGLRSYGGGAAAIWCEAALSEYVAALVAVLRAVRDVLADDGTLWLNLGDVYGAHKQLLGAPWRVAFALQDDGWFLRQEIIWHKPNPMPESVRDRCTKAHEHIFLLTKRERYYFDAEAIKEPAVYSGLPGQSVSGYKDAREFAGRHRSARDSFRREGSKRALPIPNQSAGTHRADRAESAWDTATRNKRSVWTVPTRPYAGAHFAVFPAALVEPCVLAGTSQHGHCPACGARMQRRTEPIIQVGHTGSTGSAYEAGSTANRLAMLRQAAREQGIEYTGARRTTGWALPCACGEQTKPDTVLDPFGGSGTTAGVALAHDRHAVLCELNPDYVALVPDRIAQVAIDLGRKPRKASKRRVPSPTENQLPLELSPDD